MNVLRNTFHASGKTSQQRDDGFLRVGGEQNRRGGGCAHHVPPRQARQNTHFVPHPAGRRSAAAYSTLFLRAYSISARLSRMYSSNRLLYVGCQRLSAGRFSVMSARARQHTRVPGRGEGRGRTAGGPHDAQRVDGRARLVVRAEDVEVARAHALEHVQHRLLRAPRARGLVAALRAADARVRPPRPAPVSAKQRREGEARTRRGAR
jgi:hypothetical protein